MSANREQDAIQHGADIAHGWIIITDQENRTIVNSQMFSTQDEAAEASKWNTGAVSICPVTYRKKK